MLWGNMGNFFEWRCEKLLPIPKISVWASEGLRSEFSYFSNVCLSWLWLTTAFRLR